MAHILSHQNIVRLIHQQGLQQFMQRMMGRLEYDFTNWSDFNHSPRVSAIVPKGVIELMPVYNKEKYSFKYVNGHPHNPEHNHLCVYAVGLLADIDTGYPVLICDMTLLTAIRTACTAALSTKYCAKNNIKSIGIIGLGAQSEFLLIANLLVSHVTIVYYYDIDTAAISKFKKNIQHLSLEHVVCETVQSVVENADILITATSYAKEPIIQTKWVKPGCHIIAVGGDSPSKTEIEPSLLKESSIIVEYLPQTAIEGEIKHADIDELSIISLHDVITGGLSVRSTPQDITLFDSVGYALEDFSALMVLHETILAQHPENIPMFICRLDDPKDLYGSIN